MQLLHINADVHFVHMGPYYQDALKQTWEKIIYFFYVWQFVYRYSDEKGQYKTISMAVFLTYKTKVYMRQLKLK